MARRAPMKVTLTGLQAFQGLEFDDIIDVRSPSEFAEDHLPGAINLPVLDDDERVRVGTIYKQTSPFAARVIGASLVSANAARHLSRDLAEKPGDWRPLVYCWRGGQRSGSFATILAQIGWRVGVLEGGYKTFRRHVVDAVHDQEIRHEIVLLDGNTGTAKTRVMCHLAELGVQVLDLEALAAHRGSLFGVMPGGQPSQKKFETGIALALSQFDPARPVVIEAESNRIGVLGVPTSLWAAMKLARRVEIVAPLQARAHYLVGAYADMLKDHAQFSAILHALARYHGHERVEVWQGYFEQKAFQKLAEELMVHHYDPRYRRSRGTTGQARQSYACDALDDENLRALAVRIAADL